jgi:hypothetical protein
MLLYGIGYKDLVHVRSTTKTRVSAFIIEDETIIQIGTNQYSLWIWIEQIHKSVLGINIAEE